MIGVSVRGIETTQRNLARAGQELRGAQERGVSKASKLVSIELKQELTSPAASSPFWGRIGSTGSGLSVRSGLTRASITGGGRIFRSNDIVTSAVGSAQKHLKDHEDGGVFPGRSPKGFARVPTAAAQTAAGVDRYAGQSIRDIPGSFLLRSKTGRLWAARNAGGRNSARVELLYLLVKSVRLKPKHIFGRVADRSRPKVVQLIGAEASLVVGRANS